MAHRGHAPLWIILLASIKVCYQMHENVNNFLCQKPNITIINILPTADNLTWDTEETAEIDGICYNFTFRFLDKTTWKKEILMENYKTIYRHLHTGFTVLLSRAICNDSSIGDEGITTEITYHYPSVYISNVSCVIYNVTNLNCTWEWKDNTPSDVSYTFALRLYDKTIPCKQYLKKHRRNIGCHMKNLFQQQDDEEITRIRIWFYNNLTRYSKTFQTGSIEFLNAPKNISLTSDDDYTKLEWLSPPTVNSVSSNCFTYHIIVRKTQTNEIFKDFVTETHEHVFSDLDKDTNYSVQIRAKKIHCAKSRYWGEWSQPVFVHKDKEIFPIWIIILIVASASVVIVFLLIYLFRRYVKMLILVAIPDPSEKLKLSLYSNNINSQKCIAVHNEQPVPITEIEIVSSLMDSQGSQDSNSNNV